jgi:hypothetical protein
MPSIIEKIEKLTLPEKKEIFNALLADDELQTAVNSFEEDPFLFEELARRDEAFRKGEIKSISLDELETRLAARRNALQR